MSTLHLSRALLAASVLALAAPASAEPAPPAPPTRALVYVDEVAADAALAIDVQALTTTLCAGLARDKRLDVLCAPDVKQMLDFAATSAMVGTSGSPAAALEKRLEAARFVVQGTLRKDGDKFVLVLKAGPRAEASTMAQLFTDKPLVAVEEKTDKQQKLLERMPALAQKITAALLAPPPPPPPPPPLAK